MIQKPWCIVVWESMPVGPGAAGRTIRRGATVFLTEDAVRRWLNERRENPRPGVKFTVTDVVYGDPEPYCGDPSAFEFAPDRVLISEDLLCPTYFPS